MLFWRILSCTKSLSDHLQSVKTDLAKASELIEATLETLQSFRTDTELDEYNKYITDATSLFDITVMPLRPRRSRQLPQRLQDAIVLDSHGLCEASSTSHDIKISVYTYAKQKHLGCKKVWGQSEATLQTGRRDQKV